MTEDTASSRRPLIAAGVVAVLLTAAGTLSSPNPDPDLLFGVAQYRDPGLTAFFAASAALLAVLAVPGLAGRVALVAVRAGSVPPAAGTAIVVLAAGLLSWFFPNHYLSGDAAGVCYFTAVGRVQPSNALANYLYTGLSRSAGLDPILSIRLVGAVAAMVYAGAAVGLGRECFRSRPGRVGLTAVLLTAGTAALLFGTIEYYPPLVAAIAAYLLVGVRWLKGTGRGIWPPLTLGVAFAVHGAAGLLLPSLLVLANHGRVRPRAFRRMVLWGLLFLTPVAATFAGLWFGTWEGDPPPPGAARTGAFLGVEKQAPLLPLFHSPSDPTRRYALFDLEHILGVANLILLVAAAGVGLLAVGRRRWGDPVFNFVAAAALFLVAFPVFWNISYDVHADWDLFSSLGLPLALLGGLAFFSEQSRGGDAVRALFLSLFFLVPFVVTNHFSERHRHLYAATFGETLASALPRSLAKDAVAELLARPEGERPASPDLSPRVLRERLVEIAEGAVRRARVFAPAGLGAVPEEPAPRLEEALRRLPEASRAWPDAGDWGARLADALAREVRDAERAGRPAVPVPLLALRVVGRAAAGRTEGSLDREIALVDVLDDALEGFGAYRLADPRVTADALRSEVASALVAAGVDAARWGDLLADALLTTLERPGAHWRVLLAAQRRWDARRRAFRPPGHDEAFVRLEWLWTKEGDLRRAEAHARRWAEKVPGKARWLDLLGGILLARGEREEGRRLVERALAADPHYLLSRVRLANEMSAAGDNEGAERILVRGLRLSGLYPQVPSALFQLAWLRERRGDAEGAASAARLCLSALEGRPVTPETEDVRRRATALLRRVERRVR